LSAAPAGRITATDFQVTLLSENTALPRYRACRNTSPPTHSLRSTIWQLFGGRWLMLFHQGTLTNVPVDLQP
jgi:hypothetical protein